MLRSSHIRLILVLLSIMIGTGSAMAAAPQQSEQDPVLRTSKDALYTRLHGTYVLVRGELLLDGTTETNLVSAGINIKIGKGAVTLLTREGGCLKINNLCEDKSNSVNVMVEQRSFSLRAGQEMVLAKDDQTLKTWLLSDHIARRRMTAFRLSDGCPFVVSEYLIPTLIERVGLLKGVEHSSNKTEKAVFNKVLKMAICLDVATFSHGRYKLLNS